MARSYFSRRYLRSERKIKSTFPNKFILKSILDILKSHPTLIITGFYAYLSVIGMMYYDGMLKEFNINIFNYSEVTDFVLIPFRTPTILIYPVILIVIIFILDFVYTKILLPKLIEYKNRFTIKQLDIEVYKKTGKFLNAISQNLNKKTDQIIINFTTNISFYKKIIIPIAFIGVIFLAYNSGENQAKYLQNSKNIWNKFKSSDWYRSPQLFFNPIHYKIEEVEYFTRNSNSELGRKGIIVTSTSNYFFILMNNEKKINVLGKDQLTKVEYKINKTLSFPSNYHIIREWKK